MQPSLLYADDVLFFIKPEQQQIQLLKIVTMVYTSISGLKINFEKSEIVTTGDNTIQDSTIAQMMECRQGTLPMQYLGLPLSDSTLTRQAYLNLIHKIKKRLPGWAAKLLTFASRLVLVNAVLTAIPVYFMSVFNLPQWVKDEIEKTRRTFLWQGGTTDGTKKMHLARWDMLCRPKKLGGLGILNISNFNQALLAKWYWQWKKKEPRMWKELFTTLYCGQYIQGVKESYLFRVHLKEIYKFCDCFILRVQGNENTIQLWEEDWGLGQLKHRFDILFTFTTQKHITLASFRQQDQIANAFRDTLSPDALQQME